MSAEPARKDDIAAGAVNEALVLYTSFGRSPFPRARLPDVAAVFGEAAALELKARILALYEEMQLPLPEPDRKEGRKSATQRAVDAIASRHPELDETGLKVLAWTYSFGLR